MAPNWDVFIPLKPTARGKSRIGLDAGARQVLALAFCRDLAAAVGPAADVASVTVVCGPEDAPRLPEGVRVHPDPGTGLNAALSAAMAAEGLPGGSALVLMGDLPCATTHVLDLLLAAMSPFAQTGQVAFLCDQPGVGTTALGGPAGRLRPRFGPRSRAAHRSDGAVELTDPVFAPLRRDVDSLPDLLDAVRLGVGPHTEQAWEALQLNQKMTPE